MPYDLDNTNFVICIDRSEEYEKILHSIGYDMMKNFIESYKKTELPKHFKFTTIYYLYNLKVEEKKFNINITTFTEFISSLDNDFCNTDRGIFYY